MPLSPPGEALTISGSGWRRDPNDGKDRQRSLESSPPVYSDCGIDLGFGCGGVNASVQASNPSWPPKSSRAKVALDISSASVTSAALDVDSVHPMRDG